MLSSGPSADLESPLPSQTSYPESKKQRNTSSLAFWNLTALRREGARPPFPVQSRLQRQFKNPLPETLMQQQPTSSFVTTQTKWGKSSPEFLIPLNIIIIWGKPRAPPARSLRLLPELNWSNRLALCASKDHTSWLGERGTFRLLVSKDYTDETVNNIAAIEMTWQDSKIYFMVYLNTFVSNTMQRSLSVQFNLFLPFLLSQEMFKEIYVAVWKSEFLISDTEKEITVRKICR